MSESNESKNRLVFDLRTRIATVLNDSPLLRANIPIYERNWARARASRRPDTRRTLNP